jgi:uncharacterized protein YkwD
MRLPIVLPAVLAAAIVTAAGTYWAVASDTHHARADATQSASPSATQTFETSAPRIIAASPPAAKPRAKATLKPAVKPTAAPSATSAPVSYAVYTHPAPTQASSASQAAPPPVRGASSIEMAILNELNRERASHGRAPIMWSAQLGSAAAAHNQQMDSHNEMLHQFPGEPPAGSRIAAAGFHTSKFAENIGQGWIGYQTGLDLHVYMYTEPHSPDTHVGHRTTILNTDYRYVGISVISDSKTGKVWLTEDYAA